MEEQTNNDYEIIDDINSSCHHTKLIPNSVNATLVKEFYDYLKQLGTSENYQNQNLKQIINFAQYLGAEKTLYSVKHSAITADSDYLPEYALKKKVRWSMNSKQGTRYIKRRMGNDLKQKILSNLIHSRPTRIKKYYKMLKIKFI